MAHSSTHDALPLWLKDSASGRKLRDFLLAENVSVSPRIRSDLGLEDFFSGDVPKGLEFSSFSAPKDSYFYSKLLERALMRYGARYAYVDLCSGSALPFLSAVARWMNGADSRIAPIVNLLDVDPKAVSVAERNIEYLGFSPKMSSSVVSVEDFFREFNGGAGTVVSLNPPYVPFPSKYVPEEFLPVAAGHDGLQFTLPALSAEYSLDARLVIEWSSLADPVKVLDRIRERFIVDECAAQEISFGKYTRSQIIHDHLETRRAQDACLFGESEGSETQLLIGCLLRAKI